MLPSLRSSSPPPAAIRGHLLANSSPVVTPGLASLWDEGRNRRRGECRNDGSCVCSRFQPPLMSVLAHPHHLAGFGGQKRLQDQIRHVLPGPFPVGAAPARRALVAHSYLMPAVGVFLPLPTPPARRCRWMDARSRRPPPAQRGIHRLPVVVRVATRQVEPASEAGLSHCRHPQTAARSAPPHPPGVRSGPSPVLP